MQVSTGNSYYSFIPLHRPVKVTHTETLDEAHSREPAQQHPNRVRCQLTVGTPLYLSPYLVVEPFTATDKLEEKPEKKVNENAPPKRVTLADFVKNVGIGTGLAVPPLTVIPVANATTQSGLAAQLTSYGFAPNASDQMAAAALNFARSQLGQICCVFLAGSAVVLGTIEAFKPHWTWKRKLLVTALGGLAVVLLVAILISLGIWGPSSDLKENHVLTGKPAVANPITVKP